MIYQIRIDGRKALSTSDQQEARRFLLDWLTAALAVDPRADQRIEVRTYGNHRLEAWADLRRELGADRVRPYRIRTAPNGGHREERKISCTE